MTSLFSFKRRLARLCCGGVLLSALLLSPETCSSDAAVTNLFTGVGHGLIDTAATATGAGDEANAIVVGPLSGFFRDLWSTYVAIRVPADPVYSTLLTE